MRVLTRGLLLGVVLVMAVVATRAQEIAFTWDDLPAHSVLPVNTTRVEIGRKLIAAMKAAHLPPVYGFVNGVQLEREPLSEPMLREWRAAGFKLGNHAWSHMNLNQNSLAAWEADVLKNEPVLKKYAAGSDWHWLRFPYLAEGDTPEKRAAVRKFLAEHGYKIAAVTMSFDDWLFGEPYARCVAKNDTAAIEKLKASYLKMADEEIAYARAVSNVEWRREIPFVLLMHVGALDAEMLPQLIDLYKKRGFTFVTLEQAEKDPAYAADVNLALPYTLRSFAYSGFPLPPKPHPDVDLNTICK